MIRNKKISKQEAEYKKAKRELKLAWRKFVKALKLFLNIDD